MPGNQEEAKKNYNFILEGGTCVREAMALVGPHCHPLQVKSSPRMRALSAQNSQRRPPRFPVQAIAPPSNDTSVVRPSICRPH